MNKLMKRTWRIQSFLYKNKKIDKVYVKGDKKISYEKVIRLISILNKGGVENIGLITLPINEK